MKTSGAASLGPDLGTGFFCLRSEPRPPDFDRRPRAQNLNRRVAVLRPASCRRLSPSVGRIWQTAVIALLAIGARANPPRAQYEGALFLLDEYDACETTDGGVAVRTFQIVHYLGGARALRFRIEAGDGSTMTYLSESHNFPHTLGNTQDGVTVCYDECREDYTVVLAVNYMSYGTSTVTCSKIRVTPHPNAATVDGTACDGAAIGLYVFDLTVHTPGNACGGCPGDPHVFPGTPQIVNCMPVPVAKTTWGAIKALYQ